MVRGAIQALKSCLWHEVVGQGISTLTQVAWLSVGARGGGDCLVNAWQPMTRAYGTFTTSGTTGERSNILVGLAYPPSATVAWLGTDLPATWQPDEAKGKGLPRRRPRHFDGVVGVSRSAPGSSRL